MQPDQDTKNAGTNEAQDGELEGSSPSDTSTSARDDEKQYPPTWQLVLVTIALCFALLLVSLDSTVLATGIPSITTDFNSLSDVAWYASLYLFAVSALQLLYGKLYTMYSAK